MRGGSSTPPSPPPPAETAPVENALAAAANEGTADVENQVSQTSNLGPNAPPPGFLRSMLPSLPWHTFPDVLTYLRCISIPILMILFYLPNKHIATSVIFAVASFTDWLDGFLARRWDITSSFGAFLDPVADKLMVATSLILLAGRYGAEVAIPTSIILSREISVSALREWMAQQGKRDSVKVGWQGKVKTAATMFSLSVLLLVPYGEGVAKTALSRLYQPGLAMLYLCTVLTVTSGSVYFRAAAPVLMGKE